MHFQKERRIHETEPVNAYLKGLKVKTTVDESCIYEQFIASFLPYPTAVDAPTT